MDRKPFLKALQHNWDAGKFLCVGLDTIPEKIPKHIDSASTAVRMFDFNMEIVEATKDLVCAYKLNRAFYEAVGDEGMEALQCTIVNTQEAAPEAIVIDDQKRDDIGKTNQQYVNDCFDRLSADAVTVHPTFGQEGLQPFLAAEGKGIIVLCKTSNKGSGEFQDRLLAIPKDEFNEMEERYLQPNSITANGWELTHNYVLIPLYQYVALRVGYHWNKDRNCGLVVGATYPEQLAKVRQLVPHLPILIPGIGTQGGDIEATVKAGRDYKDQGMIINVSSSLIYISSERDFAKAVRKEALRLTDEIHKALRS